MTAKEIFMKFLTGFKKELELAEQTPEDKTEAAEEVKAGEVKISELVVGGKVEAIDGEGNLVAASDGQYKLETGDTIEVKAGFIETINGEGAVEKEEEKEEPAEDKEEKEEDKDDEKFESEEEAEVEAEDETVAEEAVVEDEAEAKPSEEIIALQSEVETLKQTIQEMKEAFAAFASKEDVAQLKEDLENGVGEMNKTLATFAKMPQQFSRTNKSNVVKDAQEAKEAKMNSLINILNSVKK